MSLDAGLTSGPAVREPIAGFRVKVSKGSLSELDALRAAYLPQFECDAINRHERAQFSFESSNYRLGVTRLALISASAWSYERSARHCSRSESDAISIGFYLSGRHAGAYGNVEMDLGPGDITVTQADRPTKVTSSASESIRIIVERRAVAPLVADLDKAHGLVLRRGTPLNALLGAHLTELKAQAGKLEETEATALGHATAALAAACIGSAPAAREAAAASLSIAALTLVRRTIEANLANPKLGPDFVARHCGLSRAALYRVAEPLGGVRRYIQERRLARAWADIVDPNAGSRRIGTIGDHWGFPDASSFSRAFSNRYGVTPSELRREAPSLAARDWERIGSVDGGFAALRQWLTASQR